MRRQQLLGYFVIVSLGAVVSLMNACSGSFRPHHDDVIDSSSLLDSTQLFQKSQRILRRNCLGCHGDGGSAPNFAFETANEYVLAGLVTPGSPSDSKLVTRIINYGGRRSNMPTNGSPLSVEDYETLYNWVLTMNSGESPFQCVNPEFSLADLGASHGKRLSVLQYTNVLTDLLDIAIPLSNAQSIVEQALIAFPLPRDTGEIFKRENNSFLASHADSFFSVADQVGSDIRQNYLNSFIVNFVNLDPGGCQLPANVSSLTSVCRDQLIRNFASRAFRRPLREASAGLTTETSEIIDELASLREEFQGGDLAASVSSLVFRVLVSPHFLFQLEDQNLISPFDPGTNTYRLTSFAVASRLSLRFWNTIPDETLWGLAQSRDLSSDEGFLEALNYTMNNSVKVNLSSREFYEDWLHLDRMPVFTPNSRFPLINSQVNFNDQLRSEMIEETKELGGYITASRGSFEDLFTSNISFARSDDLMNLYSQAQRAPASVSAENAVRFTNGRTGLLTRAAWLVSGSELTNPILRGAHLRKDILCLELGSAPADALEVFEQTPVPRIATTREKVHIKTSGADCVGCHALINPLGFALSRYNAFGMYVENEPVFSEDGSFIETTVPVDASADLSPILGQGSFANNSADLNRMVANADTAKSCFAQKFASYALERSISSERDACALDRVFNSLSPEGQLIDMYRTLALEPEFRLRKID